LARFGYLNHFTLYKVGAGVEVTAPPPCIFH
jgi:hypothetical protein